MQREHCIEIEHIQIILFFLCLLLLYFSWLFVFLWFYVIHRKTIFKWNLKKITIFAVCLMHIFCWNNIDFCFHIKWMQNTHIYIILKYASSNVAAITLIQSDFNISQPMFTLISYLIEDSCLLNIVCVFANRCHYDFFFHFFHVFL